MKKLFIVCLVFAVAMTFGFTSAFAQPSAKATCAAGDLSMVAFHSAAPIFSQTIHTASQKDLFVDVSLECGLTTNTKVISKNLARAVAETEATVLVWVEVDGVMAAPGEVIFARRSQTLIAEFAGDISEALSVECDKDEFGNVTDCRLVINESLIEPETLQLILDTMTANSFNFISPNLDAGDHTVVVWANLLYVEPTTGEAIDTETVDALGEAFSNAYLGKGSVTIESVRLVKGEGPVAVE